ncbi:MAG TPA: type II toxin-antitoxin system RelE/ParE family toxin [Bryobacteraceae bacterium]|nr:type II toxin-antitoxin system RelE/ParE family toxin [Bryobacteraceae bacterium]
MKVPVVQKWINSLPDDVRDELEDVISYLRFLEREAWVRPQFETLDKGLCEIRWKSASGNYRLYGYFGPARRQFSGYSGSQKKKNKDVDTEKQAQSRKNLFDRGIGELDDLEFNTTKAKDSGSSSAK